MHPNHPRKENVVASAIRASGPCWWRTTVACLFVAVLAWISPAMAGAEVPATNSAATLRARYEELRGSLSDNQFKLPLYLESRQTSGGLRGDVHAIVDYSFPTLCTAMNGAPQWCDIMLLHLNVKYCRSAVDGAAHRVTVYLGRKHEQPLESAHRIEFIYEVAAETPDYRQVVLRAEKGPVGTKNYQIILEAIPLDRGQTFIHLSYSYAFGFAAKMAAQAYFSTMGSAKVGFTITGKDSEGRPIYVDDLRGALERNTMRYYLAIDAYLGALSAPPEEQFERRLRTWFASTERYPLQLHEVTEDEYLNMKRNEYKRQQSPLSLKNQ